jgi:hypothetical protein
MNNLFLLALTTILLLPLVPAFLLYKFLPSKTNVSGPFKGLNVKLTGAFGGYFLLVLTSLGIFFPILKNQQQKEIELLQQKITELLNNAGRQENWRLHGMVVSAAPQQTTMFFNRQGARFEPTGEFEMAFAVEKMNGKPVLPKSVCIFNKADGYKVINISRELAINDDIKNLNITFNDSLRHIEVGNVIDIQSKEKARIETENKLLEQIKTKKVNPVIYNPVANTTLIKAEKITAMKEMMKFKAPE